MELKFLSDFKLNKIVTCLDLIPTFEIERKNKQHKEQGTSVSIKFLYWSACLFFDKNCFIHTFATPKMLLLKSATLTQIQFSFIKINLE